MNDVWHLQSEKLRLSPVYMSIGAWEGTQIQSKVTACILKNVNAMEETQKI